MEPIYDVEEYVTLDGNSPFGEWLLSLKDKRAQAKLHARIRKASLGNLGDWKGIKGAKGLFEMREHYGPGYRIFYSIIGQRLVLLLAGSEKKGQAKTIDRAEEYLLDYKKRTKS